MSRAAVLLASAAVLAASAWALVRWHEGRVHTIAQQAVVTERGRLQREADQVLAAAAKRVAQREHAARVELEEVKRENADLLALVDHEAARARAERERLQRALSAAVRGGDGAASPDPGAAAGADGLGPVAAALSECSERYETVAGVADRLSVQVTGLQGYIERVVLDVVAGDGLQLEGRPQE